MLLTVAAAIFVFGLLVLFHELGHFITAKLTGMRVDEFAIGFGPKIFRVRYGETVYSLRAIPLGGFNDIAGMDPSDNQAGERGYCEKPVLSRMIVILAGSAMNFILPIMIFFGVYCFQGVANPSPDAVLGAVVDDMPAQKAGLQDGDKILSINGEPIATWDEFTTKLSEDTEANPVVIQYERNSQVAEVEVTPTIEKSTGRVLIGVQRFMNYESQGIFSSFAMALEHTQEILAMMLNALAGLVMSPSGAAVTGPIGIAKMAGQVATLGFIPLLNFAALLSLNLGIINLLPVPALDGGHFVGLVIEAVRGKPLSPKALMYTQRVGIALLLILTVVVTAKDIVNVFFK
ncbi:MAG: RIP metalloprotease RseP [Selenomonadaceae bacterium]|nr:RIP metalloprotease RseP [Selenomonadaceae bacterium]